jgi:hypothetical protein
MVLCGECLLAPNRAGPTRSEAPLTEIRRYDQN